MFKSEINYGWWLYKQISMANISVEREFKIECGRLDIYLPGVLIVELKLKASARSKKAHLGQLKKYTDELGVPGVLVAAEVAQGGEYALDTKGLLLKISGLYPLSQMMPILGQWQARGLL